MSTQLLVKGGKIYAAGVKMADISMCEGEACPLRETCYRFKAKPCPYAQTFFLETPVTYTLDGTPECKHYWATAPEGEGSK